MITNRMKILKHIIIACGVLMALPAHAERSFQKFVEKHDVDDVTKNLKSDNPADFWTSMLENNQTYQEFREKMATKRGAEREVDRKISEMVRFEPKYSPDVLEELQPYADSIYSVIGKLKDMEVCFVADKTIDAFSTLSSDGHVVGLNVGLLFAKGMTEDRLLGVAAHEYAHSCLSHIENSLYSDAKRRRRNDLIVAVTAGLQAVSKMTTSIFFPLPTTTPDSISKKIIQAEIDNYYGMIQSHHEDLVKYHFKYMQEQELEADLMAFRFLEWSGRDGREYIETLKILEANYPYQMTEEEKEISDHPPLRERITFLQFVADHHELGNTANKKLLKEKSRKEKFGNDPLYD